MDALIMFVVLATIAIPAFAEAAAVTNIFDAWSRTTSA
jgi:hypothetical protein